MPKLNGRLPKYRLHKKSGQGIVTLDGRDFYCGPYDNPASRAKFDRLIAEWLGNGRRLHTDQIPETPDPVTVNELVLAFLEHAIRYYRRPDGTPTSHVNSLKQALLPLTELYGDESVDEFGPLALKAVRQRMCELDWCRTNINNQISNLKSVFRWGVEEEMVPAQVHQALLAVKGLGRGRTGVREAPRVKPVSENLIEAVKPFVSDQIWAIIQLQLLTGARPGEVLDMRLKDLNTSGEIWTFTPEHHKTAHLDYERVIHLGHQAQEVIWPFITQRPLEAFLFSPAEAELQHRAKRHAERKTPLSCGNRPGTNRRSKPRRQAGDRYDVAAYRRAITRACDQAFPLPPELAQGVVSIAGHARKETTAEWKARLGPVKWQKLRKWRQEHFWHPHQLRHTAATRIRKQWGIEAARAVLGHHSVSVTKHYAELDAALSERVAKDAG